MMILIRYATMFEYLQCMHMYTVACAGHMEFGLSAVKVVHLEDC